MNIWNIIIFIRGNLLLYIDYIEEHLNPGDVRLVKCYQINILLPYGGQNIL